MPREYCFSCLGGRVSVLRVQRVTSVDVLGLRFCRAPDRLLLRVPLLLHYTRLGERASAVVCGGLWTHWRVGVQTLSASCRQWASYTRAGALQRWALGPLAVSRIGGEWVLMARSKVLWSKFKKGENNG